MAIFAYCEDSTQARERRETALEPHMAHLRRVIAQVGLAAPLANADGAAMAGDDRLVGSLFAIMTDQVSVAEAVMSADPYFSEGVWRRIDFYRTGRLSGAWCDDARPTRAPAPPQALYAALVSAGNDAPVADAPADVLLAGLLHHALSIGSTPATPFSELRLLHADDIASAQARIDASLRANGDPRTAVVFAVPIASGSMVGVGRI